MVIRLFKTGWFVEFDYNNLAIGVNREYADEAILFAIYLRLKELYLCLCSITKRIRLDTFQNSLVHFYIKRGSFIGSKIKDGLQIELSIGKHILIDKFKAYSVEPHFNPKLRVYKVRNKNIVKKVELLKDVL